MAPHRNHIEARASREPVRQFVSETHDHKPDAPAAPAVANPDFFYGTSFAVDQLAIDHEGLRTQLKALQAAHGAKEGVAMKLSAEAASRILGQMQGLANVLSRMAVEHINRRPRV